MGRAVEPPKRRSCGGPSQLAPRRTLAGVSSWPTVRVEQPLVNVRSRLPDRRSKFEETRSGGLARQPSRIATVDQAFACNPSKLSRDPRWHGPEELTPDLECLIDGTQLIAITGANRGGKSTIMDNFHAPAAFNRSTWGDLTAERSSVLLPIGCHRFNIGCHRFNAGLPRSQPINGYHHLSASSSRPCIATDGGRAVPCAARRCLAGGPGAPGPAVR